MEIKATAQVYNNSITVIEDSCSANLIIRTPVGTAKIEVVSGGATGTTGATGTIPIIKKADGNTGGASVIEVGDIVYFKDVTDGVDTITLVGHTYNGGDIDLRASYSKEKTIEI